MRLPAKSEPAVHRIGEVAERSGPSPRTVRHHAHRDVERLLGIQQMKPLELSLSQLRDLLDLRQQLGDPAKARDKSALLGRLFGHVAEVEKSWEEPRAKLAFAEATASMLRREAGGKGRPADSR